MSPVRHRGGTLRAAVAALAAVLMLAAFVPSALADNFGGKLPANSWTASPIEGPIHFEVGEEYVSARNICVGPVTYNGTYHFPYGWKCAGFRVIDEFPSLIGHAGVKNPNSVQITFGVLWT